MVGKADRDTIKEWLLEGIQKGATHCLVICDTWDYAEGFEDFPLYVMPQDDVNKVVAKYPPGGIERLDGIYDLGVDIEQLLQKESLLKQPLRWYKK